MSKRRFLSKEEAVLAVGDRRLGVYSCPLCAGFHLTSQSVVASVEKEKVARLMEKPELDFSVATRVRWTKISSDDVPG